MEATSQKQVDQMNKVYHYLIDNAQGRECAVTRDRLVSALFMSDRKVRDLIGDLRKDGVLVGSSPDGKGYWICETASEAQEVVNVFKAYARDLEETVRALERSSAAKFPFEQMRIA